MVITTTTTTITTPPPPSNNQPHKRRRYLLFAADPYEVISFKVPNVEVEKTEGKLFTHCESCFGAPNRAPWQPPCALHAAVA